MSFSLHAYNKVPLWKSPHVREFVQPFPIIENNYHVEAEQYNEGIKKILLDGIDVQSKLTNVKAKMSSWFMHKEHKEFAWVCGKAESLAIRNSPHQVDYRIQDCWGAIYKKGDWTKKHDHWPCVWSFVYYVECCSKCSPLVFHDAPEGTHWIRPEIGKLVLFPAWLLHSVPEQICDHDRIMVAGNIGLSK